MSLNGNDRNFQIPPKTIRTNLFSRKSNKTSASTSVPRVRLERVLGLTVASNSGLACHSTSGLLAYTAGCVVVLFDPATDTQQHLIVPNKRTLSALTFSSDGRYLASGECGQSPCFRIWDMKDLSQISEVPGHKNGITHLAFSPDSKFLISVGTHHDNLVIVWDWRNGRKIATNKVMCKVRSLAISEDGSFFVTVGSRHVKFWYLEREKDQNVDIVPLTGRSAVLGDYKDENFLDVVCGRGSCAEYTYAVTQSGVLCQFNSRRSLEKSVSLQASSGNCLSFGESGVAVGCANGIARVYDPVMLDVVESLPLPHFLGAIASDNLPGSLAKRRKDVRYPDCAAIFFDEPFGRIVVIYNDHSFYIWDIRDSERIVPVCSQLFHSRCVWGLDIFPLNQQRRPATIPNGSFVTCSSDDTVRFWNVGDLEDEDGSDGNRKNGGSSSIGIIYNDPNMQFLCNNETNPGGVDPMDVNADSKYGIRSVKIDPFGENIAFGDRLGHIHVYELAQMRETYKIEAHESEVLCLEYSKPESGYELLASASRDRLIQIFDVKNDYNCLQTLDDHSSSITALRFAALNGARQFGLISCGVDKAVILRTIQYSADSDPKFVLNDQILSKGGVVYDMDIDNNTQSIVTANQDRQLRVYGIKSRKLERTIKGTASDEGALIKLDLQESGRFVATSCSDKNLAIIDLLNGECWATFSGHAEIVTGIKFGANNSKIVSVSGDGCVFVWKIEVGSVNGKNGATDSENVPVLSPTNSTGYFSEISYSGSEFVDEENASDISRPSKINLNDGLPSWAKIGEAKGVVTPTQEAVVNRPGGRWADKEEVEPSGFLAGDLISALDAVPRSSHSPKPSIAFEIPPENPKFVTGRASSVSGLSQPSSPSTFQKSPHSKLPLAEQKQPEEPPTIVQPSIFGFLGKQRRPLRDELDDDFDEVDDVKPSFVRTSSQTELARAFKSPDMLPDVDSDASSYVSTSSPQPSRPETPSEAANKFLNLTTSGIDRMSKGRLPNRQSVTIKNRPSPSNAPVLAPVSPPVSPPVVKSLPPVAPSKRLIQNVKLTANREKFKSTQNLSTEISAESVEKSTSDRQTNTQEISHGMRRATSMMNIGNSELQFRDGLDGYNSLLERAKARLAAISSKDKKDSPPPSHRWSMMNPLPSNTSNVNGSDKVSNIDGDDNSSVSGGDSNKAETGPATSGRLSSRFAESNSASGRTSTLRSRSSDRRASSGSNFVSKNKEYSENPSFEKKDSSSVAAVRARLNNSSVAKGDSEKTPTGVSESPTAQAIARIKADLGFSAAPIPSPSVSPVATVSASAKLHCRNLTNSLDVIFQRLNAISSDESHSEDVALYRETLLAVNAKLSPVIGSFAPTSTTSETTALDSNGPECIV